MRVHGRARRESARVELTARVSRVRATGCPCGSGRAGASGAARTAPEPGAGRAGHAGASACVLARRRAHSGRSGPRTAAWLAACARSVGRGRRARAHGESRRALSRRFSDRGARPACARGSATGLRAGAGAVGMSVATRDARAEEVQRIVSLALSEDVGRGDVTTDAIVGPDARSQAVLLVKEPGVVCGLPAAEEVFRALDADAVFEPLCSDGDVLDEPASVARVECSSRAVLTGERTALNFLGRLSGVATLTRRFVDAVAGTGAQILDTRKTTPGLRTLEKYAVRCGGGANHRFGLFDAVLIKDNHLALAGSIGAAVAAARRTGLPVQVEAETVDDVSDALVARADSILLDNMAPEQLAMAVALVAGRATLEASGGVSLETVHAIAETGVDFISIGALTHSARALDVSLEVQ